MSSIVTIDNSKTAHVVTFPQGIPDEDIVLQVGQKDSSKKRKRIVIADHNGSIFKGMDFGKNSYRNDTYQYAIGVLDEKTGSLKVYSVDHNYVMRLQETDQTAIPHLSGMNYEERRQSLTENFGSRKKKRALKAAQSNIISTENIAGVEALENAINGPTEGNLSEVNEFVNAAKDALNQHRKHLLPKHDLNATRIEDVYCIDEIIPNNILTSLVKEFESVSAGVEASETGSDVVNMCKLKLQLLNAPNIILSVLSQHSNSLFQTMTSSKSKSKMAMINKVNARLLFTSYIIRLYTLLSSAHDHAVLESEFERVRWSPNDDTRRFIIQQFSHFRNIKGKHAIQSNKIQLEKLMMHILVLLLSLSEFAVSLSHLAQELKLPVTKIASVARELGCRIEKSSTSSDDVLALAGTGEESGKPQPILVARLLFPLQFPEIRKAKASKK